MQSEWVSLSAQHPNASLIVCQVQSVTTPNASLARQQQNSFLNNTHPYSSAVPL